MHTQDLSYDIVMNDEDKIHKYLIEFENEKKMHNSGAIIFDKEEKEEVKNSFIHFIRNKYPNYIFNFSINNHALMYRIM